MNAGSCSIVVADRSTDVEVRPGSRLVTRHHEATDPDLETVIGSAEVARGDQVPTDVLVEDVQWKTNSEAGVERQRDLVFARGVFQVRSCAA